MIPNADGFSSDPSINYIGAEKQCKWKAGKTNTFAFHLRIGSQNMAWPISVQKVKACLSVGYSQRVRRPSHSIDTC